MCDQRPLSKRRPSPPSSNAAPTITGLKDPSHAEGLIWQCCACGAHVTGDHLQIHGIEIELARSRPEGSEVKCLMCGWKGLAGEVLSHEKVCSARQRPIAPVTRHVEWHTAPTKTAGVPGRNEGHDMQGRSSPASGLFLLATCCFAIFQASYPKGKRGNVAAAKALIAHLRQDHGIIRFGNLRCTACDPARIFHKTAAFYKHIRRTHYSEPFQMNSLQLDSWHDSPRGSGRWNDQSTSDHHTRDQSAPFDSDDAGQRSGIFLDDLSPNSERIDGSKGYHVLRDVPSQQFGSHPIFDPCDDESKT